MEDNLYRMDNELEQTLIQLDSARRDNAVLRFELAEARKATTKNSSSKASSAPAADEGPFDEEVNELSDEELLNLSPSIELGKPDSTIREPEPDNGDGGSADPDGIDNPLTPVEERIQIEGLPDPQAVPDDANEDPAGDSGNPFEAEDDDDQQITNPNVVTRIRLNRQLTGGYNFDKRPGHEGIIVVIEPQNAFAQYVPAAGDVVVEVRDPTAQGLAGRVAKWRFNAAETKSMMKPTLMGKGIHLQLPWPGTPPKNEELKLTVRYENEPGRLLLAEKRILVKPLTSALVAKAEAAEFEWKPERPQLRPSLHDPSKTARAFDQNNGRTFR